MNIGLFGSYLLRNHEGQKKMTEKLLIQDIVIINGLI